MFDFVNYTYSGVLSIVSTLFGLSYPLVIGCIEKIDNKFNSTRLSERSNCCASFNGITIILENNHILQHFRLAEGYLRRL